MKRTLYLLAGKHKSGSSSFQRYMARNMDFFRIKGITVVENNSSPRPVPVKRPRVNCFDLAHEVLRPSLVTPKRLGALLPIPDDRVQRQRLINSNKMLRNLPGETLLVSAEAFSFLRTPTERESFDLMFEGFDVRPVVVFRDPRSWMRSWEKNLTQRKKEFWADSDTEGTIFDFSDDSWLVDDNSIRDFFGPAARSLTYETALEKFGSIIPALLMEMELSLTECPPWDQIWVNRTE